MGERISSAVSLCAPMVSATKWFKQHIAIRTLIFTNIKILRKSQGSFLLSNKKELLPKCVNKSKSKVKGTNLPWKMFTVS
jgi:hypothetical protein